jgi:hypothetical protein
MKLPEDRFTIALPKLRSDDDSATVILAVQEHVFGLLPSPETTSWPRPYVVEVHKRSRKSYRAAAQLHAGYFRREFGYDFEQYDASDHDEDCRIFMWLAGAWHDERYPLGSVCFYRRDYKDSPNTWGMAWIWLHPYCRHQGWLKSLWPYLLRRFGTFVVEGPLSKAMQHAVDKLGDPWKDYPRHEARDRGERGTPMAGVQCRHCNEPFVLTADWSIDDHVCSKLCVICKKTGCPFVVDFGPVPAPRAFGG